MFLRRISMALAGLVSASALAHAQDANPNALRICAGSPTGNYTSAANEIGNRLRSGKVFQDVQIIPTGGSVTNLRMLLNGQCDMAFAQSDVIDLFKIDNPASREKITPFKTIYAEYTQILCPAQTGWKNLSDIAEARKTGAPVKMIVGPDGSGTAETWRALRGSNPEILDKVERVAETPDIEAVSRVKDSKDTCMLWVSGLNSADMVSANDMSIRTRSKKPALSLVSIDESALGGIKDSAGRPIYQSKTVEAKEPDRGHPGLYNNLIPDSGWLSSSKKITVPAVDAILVTTPAYRQAIRDKAGRIVTQIEDAQPTIWNKVNPQE